MKRGTDIRDAQRMNPNDLGDPLIFHLAPPAGFYLSGKISLHFVSGTDTHGSQKMKCNNIGNPLTFHLI